MNKRTKLVILACFAVVLAAGIGLGMVIGRKLAPPPDRGHRPDMQRELNLSDKQTEQMRQIWSEVMEKLRADQREQQRVLRDERDQKIQAMLTVEQKAQHEAIMKEYSTQRTTMDQARKAAFDEAVERTKLILDDAQKAKYEEMVKQGLGRPHGGHGRGERSNQGPPPSSPPAPPEP
jgi:hypothetical protein